jgi:hypothetical protein
MSRRLSLFAIAAVLSLSFFGTHAAAQSTPEESAKSFYKWYLTEIAASRDPIRDSKQKMLGKISTRLGRWIYSRSYDEYGADYFIDAQDFDENWAKYVTATRVSWHGKKAVVKVKLSVPKGTSWGFGTRFLTIGLVLESTPVWKIDSVNNRKLIN